MNNCSIPSTHAERLITNLSDKHSFTLYPSLSPYRRMDCIDLHPLKITNVSQKYQDLSVQVEIGE